ncbi:site-specific integrase [Myroides marinus]|nr:site-specific integrase [Myroides marinus]
MQNNSSNKSYCFPKNYPQKSNGTWSSKMTLKVIIKSDYKRTDGTSALYLQVFVNKVRRRFPLDIYVSVKDFDENKQRVKKRHPLADDLNLLIDKKIADINRIEVSYRLADKALTMDALLIEFSSPSAVIDFIKFYEIELDKEKSKLAPATYVQQRAVYRKLKRWKPVIYFQDITEELVDDMITYFKTVEKNSHNTISTLTKNFKKYLGRANKKGIPSPVHYSEVKHRQMRGTINFLSQDEILRVHQYYSSPFISELHKIAASKFLFSCFTGLRISDIMKLETAKIDDNILRFKSEKGKKNQTIRLNKTASELASDGYIFKAMGKEKLREYVKEVTKVASIKKHVNYHMSRHSFATNFLIQGGRVEVLQKLLGHSSITMTMIYVHVVDDVLNSQIMYLDNIIKKEDKEKPAE